MCFLKFPCFIMFPKWLLTAAVNSAYIMRQKYLRISSRFIHIIHYLKNVPTLTFLFYFPLFLSSFLHFSQISHRFTFHCTAPSFPTPSSSPSHLSSFAALLTNWGGCFYTLSLLSLHSLLSGCNEVNSPVRMWDPAGLLKSFLDHSRLWWRNTPCG